MRKPSGYQFTPENFPNTSGAVATVMKTKKDHVTSQMHEIVFEFASKTSMHGVGNAFNSPSLRKRCSWMLLTLAACIGFSIHLHTLFNEYYKYQVVVKHTSQEQQFLFPDMTFCLAGSSVNRHNMTAWNMLDRLEARFSLYALMGNLPEFFDAGVSKLIYFVSKIRYASMYEKYFAFSLNDVLVDCRINGQPCKISSIDEVSSSMYRGCYTIHGESVIKNESFGSFQNNGQGLKIIFYVQSEKLTEMSGLPAPSKSEQELLDTVEGVKVVIHGHSTHPLPEIRGVTLAPGKAYTFGLKLLQQSLLSTSAKPCANFPKGYYGIRERYTNKITRFDYSQEMCFMEKYQDHIYKQCNCVTYMYPLFEKYKQEDQCHYLSETWIYYLSYTPISAWSAEATQIIRQLMDKSTCHDTLFSNYTNSNKIDSTNCYYSCNTDVYSSSMSLANWPIFTARVPLYFKLNKMYREALSRGNWTILEDFANISALSSDKKDLISNQLIKVDALAETWKADNSAEQLAYPREKLLSDLGGNLGLWIGVSVLTILECLDLIYNVTKLIFALCQLKRHSREQASTQPHSSESMSASGQPDILPKSIKIFTTNDVSLNQGVQIRGLKYRDEYPIELNRY